MMWLHAHFGGKMSQTVVVNDCEDLGHLSLAYIRTMLKAELTILNTV